MLSLLLSVENRGVQTGNVLGMACVLIQTASLLIRIEKSHPFARQTKTRLREGKKLAKVTQPAGPTDDECSFLSWVFFFHGLWLLFLLLRDLRVQ